MGRNPCILGCLLIVGNYYVSPGPYCVTKLVYMLKINAGWVSCNGLLSFCTFGCLVMAFHVTSVLNIVFMDASPSFL